MYTDNICCKNSVTGVFLWESVSDLRVTPESLFLTGALLWNDAGPPALVCLLLLGLSTGVSQGSYICISPYSLTCFPYHAIH
jgi:hypothetical protein